MKNELFSTFLKICHEMIADNGEDSYAFDHRSGVSMLAVMDGCGGSGATKYPNLKYKTGAYIASHLAAEIVGDWFAGLSDKKDHLPISYSDVDSLTAALWQRMSGIKSEYLLTSTVIKSSMVRTLPTTLSVALVATTNAGKLAISFLNAGDSRGYLLTPSHLIQCTKDDLNEDLDALDNLSRDARMNNTVNADINFSLRLVNIAWQTPCILFVATDGIFGYFHSPMEFEYCLLDTMMAVDNTEDWEKRLDEAIGTVASDDYTMLLCAYGFTSYNSIKQQYQPRYEELQRTYISYLDAAHRDDTSIRKSLWRKYRNEYEQVLKGSSHE